MADYGRADLDPRGPGRADPSSQAATWNIKYPVGKPVRYWTGLREGDGVRSRTITKAQVLGGHTAVVWVEGHGACIALSHVEPLSMSELLEEGA